MKKTNAVLGMLSIMFMSQLSYAGNFDGGYNFANIRCKSKSHEFNFSLEHEKMGGVKSITENMGTTYEDRVRRLFIVNGAGSETRFIISQKKDNSRMEPQDPVVVLYAPTQKLDAFKKLEIAIGKGTLEQAAKSQVSTEDADCKLDSMQNNGE